MDRSKTVNRILFTITAILLLCLLTAGISCGNTTEEKGERSDAVFQVSTLDALKIGLYEGVITLDVLDRRGDFGIGTFENLDGEMVELDNTIYQVKTDGVAYIPDGEVTSPFAEVTFFDVDESFSISGIDGMESLGKAIDEKLPTRNIIIAVKIPGEFEYIKTRSVPEQDKPYPPLAEVVKNQTTFEFENAKGTIIGFLYPDYMAGVNLPDYHFHFLSEDRKSGGHLLDCRFKEATAQIDECTGLELELPRTKEFFDADFGAEEVSGE